MRDRFVPHSLFKMAACICLLALILVLLTGCGETSVFDGSKVSNETGFHMEYNVLDREETADLKLSQGEELKVVFAHSSGNVDVTVGLPGKDTIYTGTKQDNAEFYLMIPEAGVWHISVTGHRAKGRVSFTRTVDAGK